MPISRRAATVAFAALAVTLEAALTACSSSSGSGGSSGLQQAMASTSGGSAATAEFQYGNMARLRELGIVDATRKPVIDTRWQQVVGYGSGQFFSLAIGLKKVISLDLLAADSTVMIGTPPNTAIRISGGVDKAAMTAKLKSLGAKPRTFGSTTGLSLAADNEINRTPALANSGLVNQLDQVVVDDDSMTSSPNGATLQQALGSGTSLLDTGAYHDLADCLGDVIAADIRPAPASDTSTAEFAVGVRDPGSKSGVDHEVLVRPAARWEAHRAAHCPQQAPRAVRDRPDHARADLAVREHITGRLVRRRGAGCADDEVGRPGRLPARFGLARRAAGLGRHVPTAGASDTPLLMPEGDTVWLPHTAWTRRCADAN